LTLPPEVLASPVSDPDQISRAHNVPDWLICSAAEIFDTAGVIAAIEAAVANAPDQKTIRKVTVDAVNKSRDQGREAIAAAFRKDPHRAREMHRTYAYQTDIVIRLVLDVVTQHLHANHNPTKGERLALLAVGGYGRAEMAPHSDVDLLFLTPYKITGWAESVIESMLYILWDLHLKVGYSSRTIKDCLRLGQQDFTIRTALLEHRFLHGDRELAQELSDRLQNELFRNTGAEFIEAKLNERTQRHIKQGGQRYMVEPNVKEGKGGLRDLQSLYWIGKYVHGVSEPADLVRLKVFTQGEFDEFGAAENFLMAVRGFLHLITDRPMDKLTFDMQVSVAEAMGYADQAGRRAVEVFMQDYFRHATHVGELTRIFLTALEASHIKNEPRLVGFFRRRKKVKSGYKVLQNRLSVASETRFLKDRLNILRIFEEALRTGLLLHPDAMRMIAANLDLIDDEMRDNPEAARIFLDMLLKLGNPERVLRRMNELGLLAAFIPEFQPIVAMMQFNMYHSYTVDEHTIQCISTLAQIERGELVEELPIVSGILKAGVNRRILYVALLAHDLGKGQNEDHSVLGARLARRIAPRLGLKPDECEIVEWLVRNHLLMSDVAQKRDIADPRTVRDFAKAVKTGTRLDLLTVLTVCDIRGVGPTTWNNWKAVLIRNLYGACVAALDTELEETNAQGGADKAKRALREALPDWDKKQLRIETARHYDPYWQGLPTSAQVVFAGLLKEPPSDRIKIDIYPDMDRDATRVCFAIADHPGIFSRLAGALAIVGANVVDARTYTSRDGYATAVFWIQDAKGAPFAKSRLPRLRTMIGKTLKGEVVTREALVDRDRIKKREGAFKVPTTITFDNEGSEIYTIIEVDTRDRAGLLYDLTRTLADNHVYIASAVIATYGEQVVDTFYVKDMVGLKFHSAARRAALETKLLAAIELGAKRARV